MISGIVYDIEKCIYKKGIDIMKKEILLVAFFVPGRWESRIRFGPRSFGQTPQHHLRRARRGHPAVGVVAKVTGPEGGGETGAVDGIGVGIPGDFHMGARVPAPVMIPDPGAFAHAVPAGYRLHIVPDVPVPIAAEHPAGIPGAEERKEVGLYSHPATEAG